MAATDAAVEMLKKATDSNGLIADPAAARAAVLARLAAEFPGFKHSDYRQAVNRWLDKSLQSGPLDTLYPKYLIHQALDEGHAGDFVTAAYYAGRWSAHDMETVWPQAALEVKQELLELIAMGSDSDVEAAADELNQAFPLANKELADARRHVGAWTGQRYRNVQNWLRYGKHTQGKNLADKLLRYFETPLYRAPRRPLPAVTALWRGIHGDMATAFQKRGVHEERGFLAFTRDMGIARQFSQKQAVMRLAVSDVLPGTPWIWFDCRGQPESSAGYEEEVLLPPGVLRVGTRDSTFQEPGALPVTYTPTAPGRMWPIPEAEYEVWKGASMPAPRGVRQMAARKRG